MGITIRQQCNDCGYHKRDEKKYEPVDNVGCNEK